MIGLCKEKEKQLEKEAEREKEHQELLDFKRDKALLGAFIFYSSSSFIYEQQKIELEDSIK